MGECVHKAKNTHHIRIHCSLQLSSLSLPFSGIALQSVCMCVRVFVYVRLRIQVHVFIPIQHEIMLVLFVVTLDDSQERQLGRLSLVA